MQPRMQVIAVNAQSTWQLIREDYESGKFSQSDLERTHGVSRKAIWKRAAKEHWVTPQVTGHRSQVTSDTHLTPKKEMGRQEKQSAFLAAFAKTAIVLSSAQEAGIARQTVYEWLEHDEAFSLAYHQAKEDAKDTIRAEIYRRAVQGWDEDVYQLAKFAGTVHKYDTTLLIFHAKMLMPEYREKQQVEVNTGGDLQKLIEAISQELAPSPDRRVAVAKMLMEKAREHSK